VEITVDVGEVVSREKFQGLNDKFFARRFIAFLIDYR